MNLFKKCLTFILLFSQGKHVNSYFGVDLINILHLPKLPPETAVSIVKSSTAILPQFDSIGHHVLQANEVLINKLLELNLDPSIKKKLILQVIDMTRQGDEMGGKILQDYYDLINYLL